MNHMLPLDQQQLERKQWHGHQKKISVYDAFIFFNELDLLNIRLHVLNDAVDYFVIVEATQTFSGLPKNLFFEEHKERFKKFAEKIIYHKVNDMPADAADLRQRLLNDHLHSIDRESIITTLASPYVAKGQEHWLREFYQKETMKRALALTRLHDDDICFISDLDEIWNPEADFDLTNNCLYKFKQKIYAYYLNNRSSEPWAGTFASMYKNIKNNSINRLDGLDKKQYTFVENGGWHFTNQGGIEQIQTKLRSYGHQEFNTERIRFLLKKRMQKNQDFIGRTFTFWVDESDLPSYLLDNKKIYHNLFKTTTRHERQKTKSVIIKLQGGLGNQMFQYAFGRHLSLICDKVVQYDTSWFQTQTKREYLLDRFATRINIANSRTVKKLYRYQQLRNIFNANDVRYIIKEKPFHFYPQIFNVEAPVYLDGYWQSSHYVTPIAHTLHKEFSLKLELSETAQTILDRVCATNAVSLHVRRGDYVTDLTTSTFHGTCSPNYYHAALNYIIQYVARPYVFVFSDDIPWVKQHIKLPQHVTFLSNSRLTDYEELVLMSQCHHHIIANSSFSWWGAWLNPFPQKIVIAPNRWINDPTIDTSDLIPSSWIRL